MLQKLQTQTKIREPISKKSLQKEEDKFLEQFLKKTQKRR